MSTGLAIDCATRGAAVALWQTGVPLRVSVDSGAGRSRQAETLLPLIESLLGEAEVTIAEVGGFAVSIGPGSFTSLRVGVATLKGLAFGLGEGDDEPSSAAAVSTLHAGAWAARADGSGPLSAVLDAQRGEWYAAAWPGASPGESAGDALLAEGVFTPEELAQRLPPGARVGGEPKPALREALVAAGRADLLWASGSETALEARVAAVAELGRDALERGLATPASQLLPRYVRRAEAEAQRLGSPVEPAT